MTRKAAEIRAELDQVNAQRVAIDAEITERREKLAVLNQRADELERELQPAVANEAAAGCT